MNSTIEEQIIAYLLNQQGYTAIFPDMIRDLRESSGYTYNGVSTVVQRMAGDGLVTMDRPGFERGSPYIVSLVDPEEAGE